MPDLFAAAQREERREPEATSTPIIWEPPGLGESQVPEQNAAPAGEPSSEARDYWTSPPASQAASTPSAGTLGPEIQDSAARIERLAQKQEADKTEVERSFPGEIGASLVRGALGIAKLPLQVAKIVGADVLGSQTVKKATVPLIESLEQTAESPAWKPSKEAGGKSIDLDRLISNPREVIDQITSQISNPRFWAAQLPEGAMSMIPAFVGAWAPRAVAYAGKLGTALEAAKAAGDTAKIAEIGSKLNRLATMGMYGASMAMEAAQGEEKVREYELRHPDKPISWGNRVVSILGTGVVAGGLEAFSFGRVFLGKYGGEVSLPAMIKEVLNGKSGGLLARKVIDSVATEGVTEGAQSLVENAFAKYGFDPDQKLTEGIVESMLVGAALGGVGGAWTGLNVRHKAVREVAGRVLETKRLAEEEYQGSMQAAQEGAARGEAYAGMQGPQAVVPEPAVAPPLERLTPQPTAPTPEERHQAIFGGVLGQTIKGKENRADAVRALVPQVGGFDRAERFYNLYQQGDFVTALKEFPEFSTWATPAQKEVAQGLPPAFGGRPRPQPSPMGVTGAEVAERATIPATGATEPTVPGSPPLPGAAQAAPEPTLPAAPMGVTAAAAEELSTRPKAEDLATPGASPLPSALTGQRTGPTIETAARTPTPVSEVSQTAPEVPVPEAPKSVPEAPEIAAKAPETVPTGQYRQA